MLGAMQGGDLIGRFNTVKVAARHYNSYPELAQSQGVYTNQGVYPPYYNRQNTAGAKRGLLQNILGSLFGDINSGMMTGFTPPVYDPYNQYGQNTASGMQDYYMGNTGGFYNNRNLGNGSSVRILD
jgi:hypothetical protein